MEHVGIDVHTKQSHIGSFTAAGEVRHQRLYTHRERLAAVFGARPPARSLLEASTASAWVARGVEALGPTVSGADPNDAPMSAQRRRRVQTDRPAHRTSECQRQVRAGRTMREAWVRSRTRWLRGVRALRRSARLRASPSCGRCRASTRRWPP